MIHERLKAVREALNMTQAVFAESLGLKQGSYSDIEKGKTKTPVTTQTELILKHVHNVNIEYLYGNTDKMFCSEEVKFVSEIPQRDSIPFYKDLPVGAGRYEMLKQYIDKEEVQGWIQLPNISAIAAFPIVGCSMEPYINNGDFVAISPVDRWERVEPDKIYMIVTKEDRMIKHLVVDEEDNSFLWAMSPNYPRFRVYKDEIVEIYRVVFYGRMV